MAQYGGDMMRRAAAQMGAAGMIGMNWAHQRNLYDGASGVTLQDYAEVIAQHPNYLFGTLDSDPRYAAHEYQAGVRVAHLELHWDRYEPEYAEGLDGKFSEFYATEARRKLAAWREAGMKVILSLGLHYPPTWTAMLPCNRYMDQHGAIAGGINLVWSGKSRWFAERYMRRVLEDLGPSNIWAVRIGLDAGGESLYPASDAANSYWAFDPAAQHGCPYQGWRPGQTTWKGAPFPTTMVQAWYDWYLQSLVDCLNWQTDWFTRWSDIRNFQVLMPGLGSRPSEYATAISSHLNGSGDANRTMGRGAVWHKVIEGLRNKGSVVVYISSMADGSGGDDLCQPTDATVSLSSPVVDRWSAVRWISYLARRYGLPVSGENPGRGDSAL